MLSERPLPERTARQRFWCWLLLASVSLAIVLASSVAPDAQRRTIDAVSLVNDLRQLSSDDMAGRRVGTPGGARARALLVRRFREVGLRPFSGSFERPFGGGGGGVAGVNVVGAVQGTVRPGRFIVISAHYDHIGVRNGRTFNGANDNASGAAALAVLAEYFVAHRPASSIIFAAFDGEESGLAGSRAFIRALPVDPRGLLINLNLDMIGRDPNNTLYVVGTARQPELKPLVGRMAAAVSVDLRMGHDEPGLARGEDWTRDSDHWAFMEVGIPALYFGVEDLALLHHPDDDFDTMTLDFYVRAVESLARIVELVDADPGVVNRRPTGLPR